MTLNDLPNKPNIKITKLPVFGHYYIDKDNDGNLHIKGKTMSVSTCNSLPHFDDNHIYYFYSINTNNVRYCEIEISEIEKRLMRKAKIEKLINSYS